MGQQMEKPPARECRFNLNPIAVVSFLWSETEQKDLEESGTGVFMSRSVRFQKKLTFY